MFRFACPLPLSLYTHFPWCVRKCPYCDFNSHALRDDLDEDQWIDALLADLDRELPAVAGRRIDSVFLGGGTPSLFRPECIARLLTGIRTRLPVAEDCEITLEANPGTVEQGRFRAYREAGVNRLSLGIQSFDDSSLRALGRIHDGREARAAVVAAHGAGFPELNLDLMFALPGQSPAQMQADLDQAIALAPSHLSFYQLTIEPNTAFAHQPPPLPDEDSAFMMQERAGERLQAAGFEAYEISAWSRPGHRCRHNLNYWKFGDYLGIGAGAHGKITDPRDGCIRRRVKPRHPRDYLRAVFNGDGGPVGNTRTLTPVDARFEFFLNALRLTDGFDIATFEAHTGLPWPKADPAIATALAEGWLEQSGDWLRPTEWGRLFLNDVQALFLPENENAS